MPEQTYTELTFKTLKNLIRSLQEIERTLSDAYKEFEKATRLKRVNSSAPSIQRIKGIRQYLLAEDKNEKKNKGMLKTFIALISDIQNAQRSLIDLASQMKNGEGEENGKENNKGNGKGNSKGNSNKTNKKLDYNKAKERVSKIRSFMDNSQSDDKNSSIPKDQTIPVNRRGYVLGYPEKG